MDKKSLCETTAFSGSNLAHLTLSYNNQNLQNVSTPLVAPLVVLCTVFKNSSPNQDLISRFF